MTAEFTNTKLGLRLLLRSNADELRQGDVEKLMQHIRASKLGETPNEHAGKLVRAAVAAGWIEEPKFTADNVPDMKPAHVAWYSRQIDRVYREATTVPND